MSWRIALRLLLSVLLILNGIGDAFARAGLPSAAMAVHQEAAAMAQVAGGDSCHGHEPATASDDARNKRHDADSGCCSGGTHDCSCLQHAAVIVPLALLPGPPRLRAGPVAPGSSMRLPPWLPQPIRPPILDRIA